MPRRLRDAVAADRLQDGFVLTQGFEGCLMMFLRDDWEKLERKIRALPWTDPTARRFLRFFVAPAVLLRMTRARRKQTTVILG